MKILVLLLASLVSLNAVADTAYELVCTTRFSGGVLEMSYSAPADKMDLTQTKDGILFGSSYGGTMKLKLNGTLIFSKIVDAAAEEYGVIIEKGHLIYVNAAIEDLSGEFSDEEFFTVTFGRSFDDDSSIYATDSKRVDIGGGNAYPEVLAASCSSND